MRRRTPRLDPKASGTLLSSTHWECITLDQSLRIDLFGETLVIVPFDRWSSITKKGISVALQLAGQVRILHIDSETKRQELEALWERNVVTPLSIAGDCADMEWLTDCWVRSSTFETRSGM